MIRVPYSTARTIVTSAATSPGQQREKPGGAPHPRSVLAMVCGAIFMMMLDVTVVAAALDDIRADLGTSLDGLQWVIDAYSIPMAGVLLTVATLGDRFGRRRLFVAGVALFTASSLALALCRTILQLDLLRAVQSLGAALVFATALPLLAVAFPAAGPRARAIGVYSAFMAGATVAGPVLGGALVTAFGWRSIFLINVPIGVVIGVAALVRMPESPRQPERRADWPGSALLTGGLVAGVCCLTRGEALGWSSGPVLGLAGAAVAALVLFGWWQSRAAHPLLDLSMLRRPGFAGTAVVSVGHMATLMAATNYLAVFLVAALDYTPLQMGLRLLPISVAALVSAPLAMIAARRAPFAVSLPVTMALVTAGIALLGHVGTDSRWTHFVPGMVIGGLGLGAITALTQAAALTFARTADSGMASATFGTLRQVGMAMGVAGLGAMFGHAARDSAARGFDALPGAGSAAVPPELRDRFVAAAGSGAGHGIAAAIPEQFRAAVPALTRVSATASVDGLNALATLGTIVGVAATVLSAAAFAVGGLRARSRAS
jgi:EmrB/QacA subfamily drug resistance transporter